MSSNWLRKAVERARAQRSAPVTAVKRVRSRLVAPAPGQVSSFAEIADRMLPLPEGVSAGKIRSYQAWRPRRPLGNRIMGVSEVAHRLGCDSAVVVRLVRSGRLKAVSFGGGALLGVMAADLRDFVDSVDLKKREGK